MTAFALTDEPFTPLRQALERLEEAVSPLSGIVTAVLRTTTTPEHTPLPNHACELASSRRTLGAATVEYGSGAGLRHDVARAAAIGEALERYSASFLPEDRLWHGTARRLGERAVRPRTFALFHPQQLAQPGFPFAPFTEETETDFVEGIRVITGEPAYVPAGLVFLWPAPGGGRPIAYPTSSGLACAPTATEATLAALLELIERDAVMLAWNCRLSLPLLDWSDDRAVSAQDERFFATTAVRYSVLDGSVFLGVPVAIAVTHGPPGSGGALAVGAACAAEARDAWLKALSESFGVYRWLCIKSPAGHAVKAPEEVQTFDDHMLFYAREEQAALASFLDESDARVPISRVPALAGNRPRALLDAVVARLEERGLGVYAVDATSPDVRELGLSVVRVVCPELCQLDVSHTARYLGGHRLYNAPFDLGLARERLSVEQLNPYPHPFP